MSKTRDDQGADGRTGYFIGFVLFFPALLVIYALIAGANRLFFGSLN